MYRAAILLASLAFALTAQSFEIGEAMDVEAFWSSDPVLFVQRNGASGFQFTSDTREGADSRLDGAVTWHNLPVYETKVAFAEEGGIERVELMLYTTAGTEAIREIVDASGKRFRKLERVEKKVTREQFGEIVKKVGMALTKTGAKPPATVKDRAEGARQFSQSWPRTDIPTQATLVWNYEQEGKRTETFSANFIRLSVDGPARLKGKNSVKKIAAKGAKKISDNVVKDPRGDVFIDAIPMVDQGQKGYCSVATAERVLRYFGLEIDEHQLAQAAGTSAEGGTSTKAMKDSVAAIGRRFGLGTVVCYGDFDKDVTSRIDGLVDEVKAYNKAAKKLKRKAIEDSVYIRREGNMISYSPAALDEAMEPEVVKEMRVNGAKKSEYTRFMSDVHKQIDKGIPLFWGVVLGTYPEPNLMQTKGGHMRLIVGYNDKKKEILFSDSWGAGHELKRMPADWAWTISRCLIYLKPLAR